MTTCVCCDQQISDIHTFGDHNSPMCWECWSTLEWEDRLPWHVPGELYYVWTRTYVLYDDTDTEKGVVKP